MISCDATGPSAMVCFAPSSVVTVLYGSKFCGTPAATNTIARYAPGFDASVIAREVITPLDLERTYGLTGGHIFHGEMLPGQLLEDRPGPRRFAGIERLYLAGSGAHPGGAVTGAPGYLAARAVVDDLARLSLSS